MARNKDKVILQADFGGAGPRQVLGDAMKDVEHFKQIIVLGMNDSGEVEIYSSEMTNAELALMAIRMSGYSTLVINGWEE